MRPHQFNHNFPHGQHFNHFPNQMHNFGYAPRQLPPMMPPNFQGPPNFHGPNFQGPNIPKAPGLGVGAGAAGAPKLESFMNTANKFLATAQSFQPLIQQATPMFRNLPAIWKLYKGFQSIPSTSNEEEKPSRRESSSYEVARPRKTESAPSKPIESTRPSTPKIFQPPYDF
ncbi:VrrA/YqfQ family protein [Ureibacillus sp. NPDC094379]